MDKNDEINSVIQNTMETSSIFPKQIANKANEEVQLPGGHQIDIVRLSRVVVEHNPHSTSSSATRGTAKHSPFSLKDVE